MSEAIPLLPPLHLHGLDGENFTFIFYFNNPQVPFLSTRVFNVFCTPRYKKSSMCW